MSNGVPPPYPVPPSPSSLPLETRTHPTLTFKNVDGESARGTVARAINERVGDLRLANGEELSWAGGPGGQISGARVVGSRRLCPGDGGTGLSEVDGGGDIVDAVDGWWDGIDCKKKKFVDVVKND